jgi:hypothetical protein
MSQKTHFTVVRNAGYSGGGFGVRERHNERKNESYYNGDIDISRAEMNIHYRQKFTPDGAPETYEQTFNRLLDNGTIVKRGLKPDAKVFAELVFDVNTGYFDEHGGYEFAKSFFDEAYRCAVKEVGSENYIISAVMHADERNSALSEQLGRDVYHYHLHVVYVPVIQKEVYYRKDCKDKEKAGTLKEVISQISHSKKWPIKVPVEREGKTITVNSYSLLQDRYFQHMRDAGFDNFERGVRGSTAEHLEVLDYKIQQDKKRLADVSAQVEKSAARLEKLDKQITVKDKARATIAEVEAMGKPALLGGFNFTADETKKLKTLAKKSVTADRKVSEMKRKLEVTQREHNFKIGDMQSTIRSLAAERDSWKANYDRLWTEVKDFIQVIRKTPQRLWAFIREHKLEKTHNQEVRR